MIRAILIIIGVLIFGAAITAFAVTRDGELVTSQGQGEVVLDAGRFEALPLPGYVTDVLSADYKSYLVEVEPGIKIHVLETGSGYPVYMQHGNPTSGLLYRKVAAELPRDEVRSIMPTMVGLGFSSKVPASEHTLENHMRWMNAALEQLDLGSVVYVGQDWGGPVGMGAMTLSPDLLDGLVAMNTGFTAPTEQADLSPAHARVKTPVVGELLIENLFSIFDRLDQVQGDPQSFGPEVANLYAQPLEDSGNKKAPLALMRMVPNSPDHPSAEQMRAIEAYVDTLDIPAEIVWGLKDPILGGGLSTMKADFPNARVTETEAGHFLQEEVPTEIAAAILRVVAEVQSSSIPSASTALSEEQ